MVVGAGSVGLEAAIDLKKDGKDVIVIELQDDYQNLQASSSVIATEMLSVVEALQLEVRLSHKLMEVTDDAVICQNTKTGETVSIPADTVLLAMGVRPRIDEANSLRRACPETSSYLIGDCLYVGKNVAAATQGALKAAAYM